MGWGGWEKATTDGKGSAQSDAQDKDRTQTALETRHEAAPETRKFIGRERVPADWREMARRLGDAGRVNARKSGLRATLARLGRHV